MDSLDFTLKCPQKQSLEFFEERLVEQVIKSCSKRPKNGPSICDVKALHRILIGELNNLQGTTMAGQRGLILRVSKWKKEFKFLQMLKLKFVLCDKTFSF